MVIIMYDYKTLEFPKVLEILSQFTKTNYAKELIQNTCDSFSFNDALRLKKETEEAKLALVRLGDIPLGGLYEMKDSLKRCKDGSILNEAELLNVVGLLDCGVNVSKYFKNLETINLKVENIKEYSDNVITPQALKTSITLAISPEGRINDNASR
jgi:DNA mismatch repair protein MutS2